MSWVWLLMKTICYCKLVNDGVHRVDVAIVAILSVLGNIS